MRIAEATVRIVWRTLTSSTLLLLLLYSAVLQLYSALMCSPLLYPSRQSHACSRGHRADTFDEAMQIAEETMRTVRPNNAGVTHVGK
eukprot:4861746-Pyramimonas_sp.AAC.1